MKFTITTMSIVGSILMSITSFSADFVLAPGESRSLSNGEVVSCSSCSRLYKVCTCTHPTCLNCDNRFMKIELVNDEGIDGTGSEKI